MHGMMFVMRTHATENSRGFSHVTFAFALRAERGMVLDRSSMLGMRSLATNLASFLTSRVFRR